MGIEVMLQKFQAEVRQTPAVTVLHTLNCAICNGADVPARIVRGRNISDATLELIATYMSNDYGGKLPPADVPGSHPKLAADFGLGYAVPDAVKTYAVYAGVRMRLSVTA